MNNQTKDQLPIIEDNATAIENGIFNLVVVLCKTHGETMPMEIAKQKAADYLSAVVKSLVE